MIIEIWKFGWKHGECILSCSIDQLKQAVSPVFNYIVMVTVITLPLIVFAGITFLQEQCEGYLSQHFVGTHAYKYAY